MSNFSSPRGSGKNLSAFIRNIVWPIQNSELKLFIPMALMMLCVLFNFGSLRSVKDSLVVPNIGAESISFLKLWLVLPGTVIFTLIYVKLTNILSYEHLFYLIVSFFLIFFFIFAYILYPDQELYHPDPELIAVWALRYPNLKWFIFIIGKWIYAVMYVFCELWSVVVINLMVWQYMNHIFDTRSAKRFYPILGMIGNIGLILAGNMMVICSGLSAEMLRFTIDVTCDYSCEEYVLKLIINIIIIAGIAAMLLYRYITHYVLKYYNFNTQSGDFSTHLNSDDASSCKNNHDKVNVKAKTMAMASAPVETTSQDNHNHNGHSTKTRLSMVESIKLVLSSKYLGHIVVLILCYGLLINILEGLWKARINELYTNTIDYINFMGKFNIWMGCSCVIFMIIGSNVLRRFSWLTSALITPYMLTCTGLLFFGFVIYSHETKSSQGDFNPVYFAIIIGAIQNILSKSTKYSLFDSTKEMTYIPLSLELRTKGKAAVEVIGLKFGKSMGAFIQSWMFILMPTATFDTITIYLMIVFIIVMVFWIWNIKILNREYLKLTTL